MDQPERAQTVPLSPESPQAPEAAAATAAAQATPAPAAAPTAAAAATAPAAAPAAAAPAAVTPAPDAVANPPAAEPAAAAAATAPTPTDSVPEFALQLRQLELKAEEHHDAWLRAKAETENVRRRAQEDIAKASKFSVEKFARDLLAVRDALEAALADPTQSVDNLKAGVDLTLKQLTTAFDRAGLVQVNPAGEKFDPHRHQAVSMVDSDKDANTVVEVFQKGYLIADRVLRPAMVTVAKGK